MGLLHTRKGKYQLQALLYKMQRDALCGTEQDRVWNSGGYDSKENVMKECYQKRPMNQTR